MKRADTKTMTQEEWLSLTISDALALNVYVGETNPWSPGKTRLKKCTIQSVGRNYAHVRSRGDVVEKVSFKYLRIDRGSD